MRPTKTNLNTSKSQRKKQIKTPSKKTIILSVTLLTALLFTGFLVAFMVSYIMIKVPQPGEIKLNQVAVLKYSDGSDMIKLIPPDGNRQQVDLDKIPKHLQQAVIAIEDRSFATNPGFSVRGLLRAMKDNIFGSGGTQGGSTITQQYVKNALVGNDRTLKRKWKELIAATKMAKEWSKDEILESYLNTVYFGRNSYGVAAAANSYFGKSVQELSIAESAVLAATLRAPSFYDPVLHPQESQARWSYVLNSMVETKVLSAEKKNTLVYPQVLSEHEFYNQDDPKVRGPLGLVRKQVFQELLKSGITEQQINTDGLQIITTINKVTQTAMREVIEEKLQASPTNYRSAAVSIDPRTGAVRGYFGGLDGLGYDFAQAGLQTGSTFKVFALVAALKQNIPLSKKLDSSPLHVGNITIENSDGISCGICDLATATKMSLNTSYYRLMLSLENTAQDVADAAHEAGVAESFGDIKHTLAEPNNTMPENGIVLGQYLTRAIDMASAYATFAASGIYHQPFFVTKVINGQGDELLNRNNTNPERRLDMKVADNVTSALEPIAAYSRHPLAGGRLSAAKTGTAQLGDTGLNKDAWMVGYTPSLSTAVWVGTADGKDIGLMYGSGMPSDIWKYVMDTSLANTAYEKFPVPGAIAGQAGAPVYMPSKSEESKHPSTTVTSTPSPPPPSTTPAKTPRNNDITIVPGITIPNPFEIPFPGSPKH